MDSAKSLRSLLLDHTVPVAPDLWHREKDTGAIRCLACGHRCRIFEGRDGICKVRTNVAGKLLVPWGYVAGLQVDPVEKKPFFHVMPGTKALSFGMLGCDFHCSYCQNWLTSQALRDANAIALPRKVTADEISKIAISRDAKILTSTYNEPLITSEWAVEIFKTGKARGLKTSYVSNGNGTREVLKYLRPHVDFYKIDLKGFDDKRYRSLGGVLANVCETIRQVYAMGFWLELVTLVIPGFNDGDDELKRLCDFVASVSPEIPWHATAYHEDYKMDGNGNTSVETLLRAAEIGRAAGLKFIYLGNLAGRVGDWENTYCPDCRALLVRRSGYLIRENHLVDGACPACQRGIPGRWN